MYNKEPLKLNFVFVISRFDDIEALSLPPMNFENFIKLSRVIAEVKVNFKVFFMVHPLMIMIMINTLELVLG